MNSNIDLQEIKRYADFEKRLAEIKRIESLSEQLQKNDTSESTLQGLNQEWNPYSGKWINRKD